MVCKICPARRHCFDKGYCENCEFGKAFEGLKAKNERLKKKNAKLWAENRKLKNKEEKHEDQTF